MTLKSLQPLQMIPLLLLVASTQAAPLTAGQVRGKGVEIMAYGATLRVTLDGRPFTDYHYQNVSRPFLYPVLGPEGLPMTRNWPMGFAGGEERDHPHHRSLWFAHGDINGVDFWAEGESRGRTVHDGFLEVKSGDRSGLIRTKNRLEDKDGKVIATDERALRIYLRDNGARMLDYEITVHASEGEIVFGDTKEGAMALRLNPTLRLSGKVGRGHIINSEGVRDKDTWGQRAAWCDYSGPVDGKTVGVAIFDHPTNPRHPTWWHVRDYGLFAANPFGVHDFEKKAPGTGDLTVPAGGSVTFRYRILFHRGDEVEGHVADEYQKYLAE